MNDLNLLLVEGRLTRDPELKYTTSGTAIANFSIAVNRYRKSDNGYDEEVSFLDVTAWGKQAESCNEYLTKGRGVRIQGRVKQERWEKDGQKRSRVTIQADRVDFKPQKEEGAEPRVEQAKDPIPFEDDIPF